MVTTNETRLMRFRTTKQSFLSAAVPSNYSIRQLEQAAKRNARAWQGRPFYTGRTNDRDRIPRGSDEREDEWLTYGRL